MLNEKLQRAEDGSRQRLIIYSLVIAVILLASALFMIISIGGFWQKQAADISAVEDPVSATVALPGKTTADPEAQRRDFVAGLAKYEKEHEAVVATAEFANWDAALQTRLANSKETATTEFASGNYETALLALNRLLEDGGLAIQGFEAAYQESLKKARVAYDADAVAEAKIYIAQALSYKASEEAMQFSETVEKLQSVLDLIKLNNVAKVENNVAEERRLSEEIFKLDPARVVYGERVAQIDQQWKDQRYETAITTGLAAFKKRDLKNLDAAAQQARKIYPSNAETAALESKVIFLKTDIAFHGFLKKGNAAIEQDNWKQANENFAQATALKSDNAEANAGLTISSDILASLYEIQAYNRDPGRLSNEQVSAKATATIAEAKVLASLSPALAREIVDLEQAIIDQNRPIGIIVISDKLANVFVRGVGQIGSVDRYRIELKPGTYLFEGRRDGFKAKIVEVEIKPTDVLVEVRVIPDERI
ncbi:MAG: hypothetical protein V7723_00305 [Sneathiella sp.]|uniref:hypothetical protein n=1 Tax=Sneathiella sp. TaxID=1964365 RepID=UPI00300152FF